MDNETFDGLPPALQAAVLRGVLGDLFGEAQVDQFWEQLEPVIRDRVGHADRRIPGETPDPKDNFWGGSWQIYDAD